MDHSQCIFDSNNQDRLHELDVMNAELKPKVSHYSFNGASLLRFGFIGLLISLAAHFLFKTAPAPGMTAVNSNVQLDKTSLLDRNFSTNEKFLIMDYSPWLGFNNLRYMIERGLYISNMLNRTLVLPNNLRIRQCSDQDICKRTALPLNLEAIGRNDQGSTMALDLGYFFDLTHLSTMMNGQVIDYRTFMETVIGLPKGAPLVDTQYGAQTAFWQEYIHEQKSLGLQPLDDTTFIASSDEDKDTYTYRGTLLGNQYAPGILMKRIRRESWDLEDTDTNSDIQNVIRNGLVDSFENPSLEEHIGNDEAESLKFKRRFYAFSDVRGGGLSKIVEWSLDFDYTLMASDNSTYHTKPKLSNCQPPREDPSSKEIPWEARFPAFATCRIENYVGIKQELELATETILSIEGQFHTTGWIPIIYSSLEGAEKYRNIARTYLKYSPAVYEAADHIMKNLRNKILSTNKSAEGDLNEPSWFLLSMHVRRGDFVTDEYGWQEFSDSWMKTIVKGAVDKIFITELPSTTDPLSESQKRYFYMATDETSPLVIDYFHSIGALLFEDLIDDQFEERFGHLIVYDDWIGLVEQLICAEAKHFYGTMTSSFTSGIINMRFNQKYSDYSYLIKTGGPILPKSHTQY